MGDKIELIRFWRPKTGGVFGRLVRYGVVEAFTLEDTPRKGGKIAGETAIPAGTYSLTMREKGRWADAAEKSFLFSGVPELKNVPGFTHILVHWGNTTDDTRGCILVGNSISGGFDEGIGRRPTLRDSVRSFKRLMDKGVFAASQIEIIEHA